MKIDCGFWNSKDEYIEDIQEIDMKEYNIKDYLNPELSKEIIEKLVKENAELKKENQAYKSSIIANLDKQISNRLSEVLDENEKMKQTLQEIKKIAERCNLCEECSGVEDCERECGDAVEPCSTYQMQIILNKITKAEVGE